MSLRRTALWLLDLIFPLYTFGFTRERRRYWQRLPARRATKVFLALFFVFSGVAFFLDLLAGGIYPSWGIILVAVTLGGLRVVTMLTELHKPRFIIVPILLIFATFLLFAHLPRQGRTPEFTRH